MAAQPRRGGAAAGCAAMSRVRGFATYRPQARSLELIEAVQLILLDMADYLPMTLRQVFYRLVVKEQIEKTENGYARLCEICNRARRGGWIDFDDIRDDGPTIKRGYDFTDEGDLKDYIAGVHTGARMDLQSFQDRRVWLWCEAAGMVPQLARIAEEYGVSVISSGGFDSLTMKHDMAQQLQDDSVVLHLGDYDPSGVHIFNSLVEDISALGAEAEFVRLAVTPEQVLALRLPTAPAKKTDNRSFDGNQTTQCEAISPPDLARIVEGAILEYTDLNAYQEALAWQEQIREASS
jgi:hypothetical protein